MAVDRMERGESRSGRAAAVVTILDGITSIAIGLAMVVAFFAIIAKSVPLMPGLYVGAGMAGAALTTAVLSAIVHSLDRIRQAVEARDGGYHE